MKKIYLFLFFTLLMVLNVLNTTGQNKYTVKIVQPDPVQAPVINSVTVSTENKNQIAWEQKPNENIQYFKIYRDALNPEDGWVNVGKAMYPGNFSFTDPSSYPSIRSYQYRISTVDKCGNEIFNTQIHKTIKLTIDGISNAAYLLKWNLYEGFDTEGYKIYRGSDATNLSPIDTMTVLRTTYADNENPYENAYYQVEAIKKEIIPSEKKSGIIKDKTRSNIASIRSMLTYADSADASKITIYPNPMTINAIVVFPYEANQPCTLTILDLTGKAIYTRTATTGEIEIERGNLKDGLYILQVAGKRIYRKKLMVGRN